MVSMKRAQAAMEYLMTYGWALLVIVLVLGALIYLGVLNPQGRMQDMCNLPIGFGCEVAGLSTEGTLSLRITNQQAIQLNDMSLICKTGDKDSFNLGSSGSGKTLNPGQSDIFTCELEGVDGRGLGDFINGDIRLSHDSGLDEPKTVTGTFSAKVSIE